MADRDCSCFNEAVMDGSHSGACWAQQTVNLEGRVKELERGVRTTCFSCNKTIHLTPSQASEVIAENIMPVCSRECDELETDGIPRPAPSLKPRPGNMTSSKQMAGR